MAVVDQHRGPALGAGGGRRLRWPGAWSGCSPSCSPPAPRASSAPPYDGRCCGAVLAPSAARARRRPGETAVLVTRGVSRRRAVPHPLPPGAGPGLRAARRSPSSRSPPRTSLSAVIVLATLPAGAGLRRPRRSRHPRPRRAAVAGDVLAVGALPRRDAGAADAGGLPPGRGPDRQHPRGHRPLPPGQPRRRCGIAFASSAVLELVATLSVALVAVTVGVRLAARPPRPAHRPGRPAPRARGLLAAAPGRRRVPRGGRGRGDLREASTRCCRAPAPDACAERRRRRATSWSTTSPWATPAGPCRRSTAPRLVVRRTGRHRGHRPLGLRQVHPALGAGRPARPPTAAGAGRRRPGRRRGLALAGRAAPAAAGLRGRHGRRQPAPGAPDADDAARLGGARAGWRSRSGSGSCRRGSTPRSARTAPRSRPASGRAWPWPGSCSPTGPWVLLDEPTAHLDALTEQVIADTLVELGRDRAVVVVAHRPALVALADHVVDLAAPTAWRPEHAEPRRAPRRARSSRSPRRRRTPRTRLAPADRPRRPRPRPPGVALTATSGWLIVQASTQPGRADPAGRHRRRPHLRPGPSGAALRRAAAVARRRAAACSPAAAWRCTTPWCRSRPGARRRRGDVLASVVDDVDSVLDRELRVPDAGARAGPRRPSLAAGRLRAARPGAGLVVAGGCVVGGARPRPRPGRRGRSRAGRVAARAAPLGARRRDHAGRRRAGDVAGRRTRRRRRRRRPVTRSPGHRAAAPAGSAWAACSRCVGCGAAVAAVALLVAPAGRRPAPVRRRSPPCWCCCRSRSPRSSSPSPTPAPPRPGPGPPRPGSTRCSRSPPAVEPPRAAGGGARRHRASRSPA